MNISKQLFTSIENAVWNNTDIHFSEEEREKIKADCLYLHEGLNPNEVEGLTDQQLAKMLIDSCKIFCEDKGLI